LDGEEVSKLEDQVFRPHWPEGLKEATLYSTECDDDGRLCDARMNVFSDNQGDMYVSMHAYNDEERGVKNLNPFPKIRIRTGIGGGRMRRTRQALLWLARAIQLDNAELGLDDDGRRPDE
jgi:hypothetical protein